MLTIFTLWSNFKFTKESLQNCRGDILRHNARSLLIISLISVILLVLFSFFPLAIEKDFSKFLVYVYAILIELLVFIFARYICKHEKYTERLINAGFLVFFCCLMGFGVYAGVLKRPEHHAGIFLIFLVCSQIIFVFNPLRIFLLNAITVGFFSFLAISIKPTVIWQSDVVNAIIASLVGMIFAWYMSHAVIKEMLSSRRLEIERNRFREESIRDELTGLSNRRDYLNAVNFYINVCRHVHQSVCAIMMDVDFFKKYNDYYGHQKGDLVLQAVGKVLKRLMMEEHVFAARVGGEEFIVLWTENRIVEAERVAVKLRQMIIDLQIPHEKSDIAPYVTASFGLYLLRGGSQDSVEDLYNQADTALYEAKKSGRNRIVFTDSADRISRPVDPQGPGEAGRRERQAGKS
jgi:diguanylate cyclase (GGDEF)-like protein